MAKTSKPAKKTTAKKVVVKATAPKKATVAKKEKKSTYVDPKPAVTVGIVGLESPVTDSEFEIVMGVEKPARSRRFGGSRYPFGVLPVGGSILVPAEVVDADLYGSLKEAQKAQAEAVAVVANRMSGAVRRFTKRAEDGKRFTVFSVSDGTLRGFKYDIGVVVRREE